jgi:hypothetical protein
MSWGPNLKCKRILQEAEGPPQAVEKGVEAELTAEPESSPAKQGEEEKLDAPRLEECTMGL